MQDEPRSVGPEQISLQIPSRYSYLRIVRQAVGDLCAQTCVSEFKAAQLEMAVDEICAELIEKLRQRAGGGGAQPLLITLRRESEGIVTEVFYSGEKVQFPALSAAAAKCTEDPAALGSYVVHRFVERVEHFRDPERGWCVRISKAL
ncbi:MAG TPA: ATP-binding protein [Kiritimatiellae bacterium]|nr:ATP-binding protein [Kiritimatiellia bacterium]